MNFLNEEQNMALYNMKYYDFEKNDITKRVEIKKVKDELHKRYIAKLDIRLALNNEMVSSILSMMNDFSKAKLYSGLVKAIYEKNGIRKEILTSQEFTDINKKCMLGKSRTLYKLNMLLEDKVKIEKKHMFQYIPNGFVLILDLDNLKIKNLISNKIHNMRDAFEEQDEAFRIAPCSFDFESIGKSQIVRVSEDVKDTILENHFNILAKYYKAKK